MLLIILSSSPSQRVKTYFLKNKETLLLPALWLRHCWSTAPPPPTMRFVRTLFTCHSGSHCVSILSCVSQHTPPISSQNRKYTVARNLCLTFSYPGSISNISLPPPAPIADSSSYCFISLSTCSSDCVLLITLHKALPGFFSECRDLHS